MLLVTGSRQTTGKSYCVLYLPSSYMDFWFVARRRERGRVVDLRQASDRTRSTAAAAGGDGRPVTSSSVYGPVSASSAPPPSPPLEGAS